MRNFVQAYMAPLTYTHTAAVVAGVPVVIGQLVLIPITSAAAGVEFSAYKSGVFRLPKAPTDTFALGANIYWDATNGRVTATVGTNRKIGVCDQAATNTDTVVWVAFSQLNA